MAFYSNPKRKRGKTRNPSLTLRVTVKNQIGHEASDLPFGASSSGFAYLEVLFFATAFDSPCKCHPELAAPPCGVRLAMNWRRRFIRWQSRRLPSSRSPLPRFACRQMRMQAPSTSFRQVEWGRGDLCVAVFHAPDSCISHDVYNNEGYVPAPLRGYRAQKAAGITSFATWIKPANCNLLPDSL